MLGTSLISEDSYRPLYAYANGIVLTLRAPGELAPGAGGDLYGYSDDSSLGINDLDQIVLHANLRGTFWAGLFLARPYGARCARDSCAVPVHKFTNSVRTEFARGHPAAVKIPREAAPEVLHQPPKRPRME